MEKLNSNESPTEASMEHALLPRSAASDQIKEISCRPTCRVRKLTNKGAIYLILVWNYLVTSEVCYVIRYTSSYGYCLLIVGFTLPFAGWLADVYFGRYKVVRWSMSIMWVGSMLATISSVVAQLVDNYQYINKDIQIALFIIMAIGYGGYQANVVLFGLDQLQDASTDEIMAFIIWYVWTVSSSAAVNDFIYGYLSEEYRLLVQLLACFYLSVVISLSFLFNHLLLKEPVTQNPFQLIYKVIRYAIKNKRPIYRSAFTYSGEDEIPSRIDFAKNKYGGPFTTEQVEDVKTVLRLLVFVFIITPLPGGIMALNQLCEKYMNLFNQADPHYTKLILGSFAFYLGLIPFYELVVNPFFQRQFIWVNSHCKLMLGALLHMARVITLMAFDLSARHTYLLHHGHNVTLQCVFDEAHGTLSSAFNYKWMALPDFFFYTSALFFTIGGFEFICAQSPYSMRGLIFGTAYGCFVLFSTLGYGITQPFTRPSNIWGSGIISCGFWFLLLILILSIIFVVCLCVFVKCYKNRKREDILPNEHIFAERYYSS